MMFAIVLRGARVDRGRHDVQVGQVLAVVVDVTFGQRERIHSQLVGAVDDLVIHIGKVHDMVDLVAAEFKVAPDDVEDQRRHGVPDMGVVINGHTADVHFYNARLERLEVFLFTGEGVVKADHISLLKWHNYKPRDEKDAGLAASWKRLGVQEF